MGSFLENRTFRVEEGEGVLNNTLKIKTTFSNTDYTEVLEGGRRVQVERTKHLKHIKLFSTTDITDIRFKILHL